MKTVILSLLLCAAVIAAHAQSVFNRTSCAVTVKPVCYSALTCVAMPCGSAVVVPPGGSVPLPSCICAQVALQGFVICWGPSTSTTCAALCTSIGASTGPWPCSNFKPTATMPACPSCLSTAATGVFYTAAGDLIVQ